MVVKLNHKFEDIISLENLLTAWQGFLSGKRHRLDVQIFATNLMDNLFALHYDLLYHRYQHGGYQSFKISDPKPRQIHKASVRDRVVHHLLYQALYDYFNGRFICDSYSCRNNKGTHRALNRFKHLAGQVSLNHSQTCYVLKGDIKKFFASINQSILLDILKQRIIDPDLLWLIEQVLVSFSASQHGVGLPLGNLTSQLFANIYLDQLDSYIKQELRVKHYIRYADDFVILSGDKNYLVNILDRIDIFLSINLKLSLHPDKVFIKTYASGVDFLGWIHFPHHRQIRTTTKRRIIRRMSSQAKPETISSYRGLLSHGNTYKISKRLRLIGV
ncbi:MAG: reverse transcriptase/maturase family protein [bacterium]